VLGGRFLFSQRDWRFVQRFWRVPLALQQRLQTVVVLQHRNGRVTTQAGSSAATFAAIFCTESSLGKDRARRFLLVSQAATG